MKLRANPGYRKFKAWFASNLSHAVTVDAEFFRVAGPRHTSPEAIISGIGGWKANGRWCRQGISKLIYLSESPETALRESNEHARRNHLPLWGQMPKVVVAIRVKSDAILDLTDPGLTADLPATFTSLLSEDWRSENSVGRESLAQVLGRAAWSVGFDGLRVPSVPEPKGINLVLFIRGPGRPRIELLNPDVLERLGKP